MRETALIHATPPVLGALAGGLLGAWLIGGGVGASAAATLGAGVAAIGYNIARRRAKALRQSEPTPSVTGKVQADLPAGYGRYLLDRMPVGVLLIDPQGRVEFVNPMAAQMFGRLPRGPFPISAMRAPPLLEAVETARRERKPAEVAFSLARAEGRHVRAAIQPLETGRRDQDRSAPILVVIEDRSEAHRGEELHRDFVANASHELKTPLASISGIIETLTGHARDDPEATERFLGIMAGQVERMKRLVEDLLSLNRIEINERVPPDEPQSIRNIVGEVAETFAPIAAAAGVTLHSDPPARLPLVAGDREELRQLFSNLVDNAIKYGRPGGEISIRVLEGGPEDTRVGIAVTDQGEGIAREDVPRLTERFYRVSVSRSRERGGTGLGLAIVKHVVQRHRGQLKIESTPDAGSTFTVWLPVLATPNRGDVVATAKRPVKRSAEDR